MIRKFRYPVGFGGDVTQSWESLKFMIYFTATASNALFPYWGHEMMKNSGNISENEELFVRVMQFGAMSPIYTNYGNINENDNLWNLNIIYLNGIKQCLILRNQLLPYRYTLAKITFNDGIGMIRPMYYEYNQWNMSYHNSTKYQYFMGNQLLIAPVFTAINQTINCSNVNVWLPPNHFWIDFWDPQITLISGFYA